MIADPWLERLLEEAEAKWRALFYETCDYTFDCTVPVKDQDGQVRWWVSCEIALRNYGQKMCGHDEAWIQRKLAEPHAKQVQHPLSRLDELQLAERAAADEFEDLREQFEDLADG